MQSIDISISGLDVEWQRLQVIAQNLANMNSVSTPGSTGYQPVRLVSGPDANFAAVLNQAGERASNAAGVRVLEMAQSENGVRRVHEPDHPMADAEGFVEYPDVDHASEMTMLIRASRVYEANLTAVSVAQQMYNAALQMGRQS